MIGLPVGDPDDLLQAVSGNSISRSKVGLRRSFGGVLMHSSYHGLSPFEKKI